MGRRKSKRQAAPKKKEYLDSVFDCPFCNHEKSCEVNMDKERNTGRVSCGKYQFFWLNYDMIKSWISG